MSCDLTNPSRMVLAWLVAVLGFTLVAGGCAKSYSNKRVDYSGFLEDYDRLEESDERYEATFRWINPAASFADYDTFIIDPVVLWRDAGSEKAMSSGQAQAMADYFHARLIEEFGERYEIVDEAGPGTARMQMVVTKVQAAVPVADTVSTVVPVALAVSSAKQLFTGHPIFTGDAAIEFRVSDATTGDVLVEGIDRRVGGKNLGKGLSKWSDVENIMDRWADMALYRLCSLRGEEDCPTP